MQRRTATRLGFYPTELQTPVNNREVFIYLYNDIVFNKVALIEIKVEHSNTDLDLVHEMYINLVPD